MDTITFAAERREVTDVQIELFRPLLEIALGTRDWEDVANAAEAEWAKIAGDNDVARETFRELLTDSLDATTPTEDDTPQRDAQVNRMALWMATFVVNDATFTDLDNQGIGKQWLTMLDEKVRDAHKVLHGDVVAAGGSFKVGNVEMRYPGEPIGNPDLWLGCRCVLAPAENVTAAGEPAPADEVVEDEGSPEDGLTYEPVPWHGVLAPVDTMSGDKRKFASGSITARDLPVPLKYMKYDKEGHEDSVVVGNITNIWEEGGLILGEGFFADTVEADEAIAMRAQNMMRGVSVDLDDTEIAMENDKGEAFDFENAGPEDIPVLVVTKGRIAAATICAIPAFQEAYFDLGTWAEAVQSDEECVDCEEPPVAEKKELDPIMAAAFGLQEGDYCVYAKCKKKATTVVKVSDSVDAMYCTEHADAHEEASAGVETFAPGTKDGPGWITNPDDTQRIRTYWVRGKGAAKIRWGAPGDFNRCRRQLSKYVENPEWLAGLCANMHKEALGVWPGRETGKHAQEGTMTASGVPAPGFRIVEKEDAITASAATLPRSVFSNPGLTAPTPVTIADDGRIFGHVASWNSCHIGVTDRCVKAPNSLANYAYFHVGAVKTDEGEVPVGHITMSTGHADLNKNSADTRSHYDNTGTVVADIACGEDDHGIWFAGALRPGVSDKQVRELRASALSGDWRRIGAGLELVAALAVNVPGFPIPRTAIAASGTMEGAMVAAAVVRPVHEIEVTQDDIFSAMARAVIKEYKMAERVEASRTKASAFFAESQERQLAPVKDRLLERFGVPEDKED